MTTGASTHASTPGPALTPASDASGVETFASWDGGCLLMGTVTGVVPVHAHYAIQIVFGPAKGVRMRAGADGAWVEYEGAMIPSRQPHCMDSSALAANVIVFVEPETREGRALTELYLRDGIAALGGDAFLAARDALYAAWRAGAGREALAAGARHVVEALTGGVAPSVVSDERILRAIAFVNRNLDARLSLEDVAAEAYLSPSRFRHLFVEQTGMALRPYILWRRFIRAWELAATGETLSACAHAAGFADAAHLTRTSRRMFGIAPSVLHGAMPRAR